MNYAGIKKTDVANGPGVRVSLFVSGCRHHCKGCFNSETWDFNYGALFDDVVMDEIMAALEPEYIEGFTVLGGEPFEPENRATVLEVIKKVREKHPDLSIWCYSGFLFEVLRDTEVSRDILRLIDVLVDGRFVEEKKNLRLKFRGSENQRLIDVPRSLEEGEVVLAEI
ncbi:MAG: anaerobic ribonucleoside-triphosphate reductase activating protein [Clostridia bacterium]|nr:anaerobic ribonucleoside-triphosphate reductase activating protein [Clostridia bacterium]